MEKNSLNKNLTIYKIKTLEKQKNYIMMMSINMGWIFLPINEQKNLFLNNILFGFNKLFKFFFKLKGFGYKWKYNLNLNKKQINVFFKLGFTHRITLITPRDVVFKLKKKRFIIKTRFYENTRNNFKFLFFLYKNYLYNKKGMYLRGTKFKIKLSKKKSKF